jgi:YegS/Rv2252/BmrU family lipid kinase
MPYLTGVKIVFVVNSRIKRREALIRRIDQCAQKYITIEIKVLKTLRKGHAVELAGQAAEKGCSCLVAVGGDGTLHEVVNGVMQSQTPAKDRPAIGLLPYGSANDFARTTRIIRSVEALFELIHSRSSRRIDLGRIRLKNSDSTRYFINITGVGLGPEIVKNIERSSGVLGPKFTYFKNIIKGFLRYTKKEVSCTGDTWHWKGKLLQMAVANGRYYGHAICTAPEAQIDDGMFQVALFENLGIWDYLKNLGPLKKGVKIEHPQVHYYDTREISIESADSCGIEADGEYVGLAPAEIHILPKAISFLLPPME